MITAERRRELRVAALERWRRVNADALRQIERAQHAIDTAAMIRDRIHFDRSIRAVDRERRAIERELRDGAARNGSVRYIDLPAVLVADPNPAERVMLMHALRRWGQVQVVGDALDGSEALGLVLVNQPDLVVLDEDLPSRSGLEVAEELRIYAPETRSILLVDDSVVADGLPVDVVFARRQGDRNGLVDVIHSMAAGS